MANYDILGNIAIVKFQDETSASEKLLFAKNFLEEHKNIKTVLEKTEKVHGRLRTIKTKYILGEKTLEAEYKESGCVFKLNIETCYFSPRLANERLEVAKMIDKTAKASKKKPRVLVMFSGVGPFSIVIAKHAKVSEVVSIELGKDCCNYAQKNVYLNQVNDIVEVLQGDVKKIVKKGGLSVKGNLVPLHFDFVIMPRPNLKETFLASALKVARKGTMIVYYGFSPETKKEKMIGEILKEAKKLKRKIKILRVLEAGDIAPYEHRYRVEMKVLN